MDMDGMPLDFCINPGNTNEQITLKPLEDTLNEKFGISKLDENEYYDRTFYKDTWVKEKVKIDGVSQELAQRLIVT